MSSLVPSSQSVRLIPNGHVMPYSMRQNVQPLNPQFNTTPILFNEQSFGRLKTIQNYICDVIPNHVRHASRPPFSFKTQELLDYFEREMTAKNLYKGPASLTGGAVGHVLTELEYGDLDFHFDVQELQPTQGEIQTSFKSKLSPTFAEIEKILFSFIRTKVPFPNLTEEQINETIRTHYLNNNKEIEKNYWCLFTLGDLDLNFFIGKQQNTYISVSDSFFIRLSSPPQIVCDAIDSTTALQGLLHREYYVHDITSAPFIFFRLLHKITQGSKILGPNVNFDVLTMAVSKIMKDFPHDDPQAIAGFQQKYRNHLYDHYPKHNHTGRMISYLNLLRMMQKCFYPKIRQKYIDAIVKLWQSEQRTYEKTPEITQPFLNTFMEYFGQDADTDNDLLAFAQGLFLLEWNNENPEISAYSFPFNRDKTKPDLHFRIIRNNKPHYLSVADNPLQIAEKFLSSWSRLEKKFKNDVKNPIEQFAKDLGFINLNISKHTRPAIVRALLNSFKESPMAKVLAEQYQGTVSPDSFLKIIKTEIDAIHKDSPGILDEQFFDCKIHQIKLEYLLSLEKRRQNSHSVSALEMILKHMLPPFRPTEALLNDFKQLSKIAFPWNKIELPQLKLWQNALKTIILRGASAATLTSLKVVQELIISIPATPEFPVEYRRSLSTTLLRAWRPRIASGDGDSILSLYKFVEQCKLWKDEDVEFKEELSNFEEFLLNALPSAGLKLIEGQDLESAYYCIEKIISSQTSKEGHGPVFKLLDHFNTCAIRMNSSPSLMLASNSALLVMEHFTIDVEQGKTILKVAQHLLAAPASDHDKTLNTAKAHKLINKVTEVTRQVEGFEIIIDSLTQLLLSENCSKANVSNLFAQIKKSYPELGVSLISKAKSIEELMVKDQQMALIEFLSCVGNYSLPLVKRHFESAHVIQFQTPTARNKLAWNLIEKCASTRSHDEIEYAYNILEKVITSSNDSINIKNAATTFTLMLSLLTILPEKAIDRCERLIPILIKTLQQTEHVKKLSFASKKTLGTALLLCLKQLLRSSANSESLCNTGLDTHLITHKEAHDVYKNLILSSIKYNGCVDLCVVKNYFNLSNKPLLQNVVKEDRNTILQTYTEQLMKRDEKSFGTALLFLNFYLAKYEWNEHVEMLTAYILEEDHLKISPADAVLFSNWVQLIIQKKCIKYIPIKSLPNLIWQLANLEEGVLADSLCQQINSSNFSKFDTWTIFYQFMVKCVLNQNFTEPHSSLISKYVMIIKQYDINEISIDLKNSASLNMIVYLSGVAYKCAHLPVCEMLLKSIHSFWCSILPSLSSKEVTPLAITMRKTLYKTFSLGKSLETFCMGMQFLEPVNRFERLDTDDIDQIHTALWTYCAQDNGTQDSPRNNLIRNTFEKLIYRSITNIYGGLTIEYNKESDQWNLKKDKRYELIYAITELVKRDLIIDSFMDVSAHLLTAFVTHAQPPSVRIVGEAYPAFPNFDSQKLSHILKECHKKMALLKLGIGYHDLLGLIASSSLSQTEFKEYGGDLVKDFEKNIAGHYYEEDLAYCISIFAVHNPSGGCKFLEQQFHLILERNPIYDNSISQMLYRLLNIAYRHGLFQIDGKRNILCDSSITNECGDLTLFTLLANLMNYEHKAPSISNLSAQLLTLLMKALSKGNSDNFYVISQFCILYHDKILLQSLHNNNFVYYTKFINTLARMIKKLAEDDPDDGKKGLYFAITLHTIFHRLITLSTILPCLKAFNSLFPNEAPLPQLLKNRSSEKDFLDKFKNKLKEDLFLNGPYSKAYIKKNGEHDTPYMIAFKKLYPVKTSETHDLYFRDVLIDVIQHFESEEELNSKLSMKSIQTVYDCFIAMFDGLLNSAPHIQTESLPQDPKNVVKITAQILSAIMLNSKLIFPKWLQKDHKLITASFVKELALTGKNRIVEITTTPPPPSQTIPPKPAKKKKKK